MGSDSDAAISGEIARGVALLRPGSDFERPAEDLLRGKHDEFSECQDDPHFRVRARERI